MRGVFPPPKNPPPPPHGGKGQRKRSLFTTLSTFLSCGSQVGCLFFRGSEQYSLSLLREERCSKHASAPPSPLRRPKLTFRSTGLVSWNPGPPIPARIFLAFAPPLPLMAMCAPPREPLRYTRQPLPPFHGPLSASFFFACLPQSLACNHGWRYNGPLYRQTGLWQNPPRGS